MFPGKPFSSSAAGTTSAAFLKIPAGAREQAMGGAAAAVVEASESMFWNPAGLARLGAESPQEVSLAYSQLLETTYSGGVAYSRPLGPQGALGAGLVYFSQSSLTAYNAQGDATGSFTPTDFAVSGGYAYRFGVADVGGALKIVRSSLAEVSGTSAAVDVGAQALHVADIGDGPLDVGGSFQNLGPPLKLGSVASPLPFAIDTGVMWHASPYANMAIDLHFPVDQDAYVSFGLEGVYAQPKWKGFLRLGYDQSHSRDVDGLAGITGGAGLDLQKLRIDYAWVPFGDLGVTNRISLAFRF